MEPRSPESSFICCVPAGVCVHTCGVMGKLARRRRRRSDRPGCSVLHCQSTGYATRTPGNEMRSWPRRCLISGCYNYNGMFSYCSRPQHSTFDSPLKLKALARISAPALAWISGAKGAASRPPRAALAQLLRRFRSAFESPFPSS